MQGDVQLMRPVAALSRGLRRTLIRDNRIEMEESEEGTLQRCFMIGGMGIVIKGARMLMEVIESPDVFPIPNAPRTCRGLINLRGGLVPVFDIRKMIGGEGASLRWLLVVGRGEDAAGFIIDRLPLQVKLSDTNQLASLPEIDATVSKAVSAAYRVGDETYLMVDHKKLLEQLVN